MHSIEQVTQEITKRQESLFAQDYNIHSNTLKSLISGAKVLIIGGAGSIGQSFLKELIQFNPLMVDVCDLSENNLVEVVRDLRSAHLDITADLNTYPLDFSSHLFYELMCHHQPYDYVVNFAALKHVRSEKNIYTLLNMCHTNFMYVYKLLEVLSQQNIKKFFSVSTDKSVNPANLMGASKRIMEQVMFAYADKMNVSSARFANVAFSDGSLLHGFVNRFHKQQPLAGPSDIKRYFISLKEAGELCMLSTFVGHNQEILFPKLSESIHLIDFPYIAESFLKQYNLKPYYAQTIEEAKQDISGYLSKGLYPCYFVESETTGEKPCEEFIHTMEEFDMTKFHHIGVVRFASSLRYDHLLNFIQQLDRFKINDPDKDKQRVVDLIASVVADLNHLEKKRYLDARM